MIKIIHTLVSTWKKALPEILSFGPCTLVGMAALLATTSTLSSATYHVDLNKGNDTSGDGSSATPFQTLNHALSIAQGGDEFVFHDGNYGDFVISGSVAIFDSWVTFRAAEGSSPQLDQFRIVGSAGPNHTGLYDAFIELSGFNILGVGVSYAVEVRGPRHIIIDKCIIESEGPYVGSDEAIEKSAVYMRGFEDVTISNCEITRTAVGISARGHGAKIMYNHIHDITHDGIRSMGLWDSLVEGNLIHGLDDGVEDSDDVDYNRHCDAIHIFIQGGALENLQPNQNVIFRGNIMYDVESQSVQFNNYGPQPSVRNNNITFENNVFGPVGAYNVFNNSDGVDTLIFRNNSVVRIDGGTSYTSPHTLTKRTIVSSNYGVAFTSDNTDLQVYNNIMSNQWDWPVESATIFDYNLIQFANLGAPTGGPNTIFSDAEQFKNPELLDGVLADNSVAIDAGSPTAEAYGLDLYNQVRDAMPDMGAYEVGGIYDAPPILEHIPSQSIFEGQELSMVIRASDPDNTTLTLTIENLPAFGTFYDNGNGTGFISFSSESVEGSYDITLSVNDGIVSDAQTFTLAVEAITDSQSTLAGHWTFENDASDLSGEGNHGTIGNGAYSFDPAHYPEDADNTHALSTSGSGIQFSAPHSNSLDITGDLTLAAFIKPDAGTAGNIISKNTNDGYRLVINNEFQPRLLLGIPGSGPHSVKSIVANVVLIPGEWQHIAVTVKFDNGTATIKFFHNNELASTHTTTLDGIESASGVLAIGSNSSGQEPYLGLIDDVRIYRGALTDAEIYLLYGDIPDDSQEYWGGYPIIDDHVNTGNWMGWLYVFDGTNCFYSYSLGNHIYCPSPDEQGSWVFFNK